MYKVILHLILQYSLKQIEKLQKELMHVSMGSFCFIIKLLNIN